jgi:hypothetical protein
MNNEAANGADFIAANEMNGTAMNGLMSPGTNIMINLSYQKFIRLYLLEQTFLDYQFVKSLFNRCSIGK